MKAISMDPRDFYGGDTPALSGDFVPGKPYFVIYPSKSEPKGGEEGRKKLTYFVMPWIEVATKVETECRYPVGLAEAFIPGADSDNYAEGNDKDGIRGEFLLPGPANNNLMPGGKFGNTYAPLWVALGKAGVDYDFLASTQEQGVGILEGAFQVTLTHVEEKYTKAGEERTRQPFNFPLPDSAKMLKSGGAPKAAAPKAAAAKAAPAGNKITPEEEAGADLIYAKIAEVVMEDLAAGNEVKRTGLSPKVTAINKELGGAVEPHAVIRVSFGTQGKGEHADRFTAAMEAAGLSIDPKTGVITPAA